MTLAKVKLVVFDLDGTLVDSARDLATAVNRTLERLAPGTSPLTDARVRSFIGNGARQLVVRSLAAAGVESSVDDTLELFLDQYRECLLDTTELYTGAMETLDRLQGHDLAVLTNKPGEMSRRILEGLGVSQRFVKIYGGGDVPERKPDPSGLRRLLSETGAGPDEALMVGDSAIDVRTGQAAGVRTVGVTYGFDPGGLAQADWRLDDLRELAAMLAA